MWGAAACQRYVSRGNTRLGCLGRTASSAAFEAGRARASADYTSQKAGLKKGVCGAVMSTHRHYVVVRLRDGTVHSIPRTTHEFTPLRMQNLTIRRHQLSLALNWAGTVHRAQWDNLSAMLFDVKDPPFTDGQVYNCKGAGRVHDGADARCLVPPEDISEDGSYFETTNVVMKEILEWADRLQV